MGGSGWRWWARPEGRVRETSPGYTSWEGTRPLVCIPGGTRAGVPPLEGPRAVALDQWVGAVVVGGCGGWWRRGGGGCGGRGGWWGWVVGGCAWWVFGGGDDTRVGRREAPRQLKREAQRQVGWSCVELSRSTATYATARSERRPIHAWPYRPLRTFGVPARARAVAEQANRGRERPTNHPNVEGQWRLCTHERRASPK